MSDNSGSSVSGSSGSTSSGSETSASRSGTSYSGSELSRSGSLSGSESSDGEEVKREIENQEKKSNHSDEQENHSHSEESDERKSESSQESGNKSSSVKSEEKKQEFPKEKEEEEEEDKKSESEDEIKRQSSSSSTSSKNKPIPQTTTSRTTSISKSDSKKSLSNDNTTTLSTTTRTRTTTSNSSNSESGTSIEESTTIDSTSTVSSNRVNGVLTIDELIKKYHIRAGRLTITLIKAINLYSPNRLISPYVQISIGHNANKIIKESSIFAHTTVTPEFNKEILTFDIKNPRNFINNNDMNMHIQIIDSETDELLGECRLSILDIISNTQNINVKTIDLFRYNDSGEKKKDGKIRFEPLFTPLRKGYIEVELKRYKNLRLLDVTKKSNICVEFKFGENQILRGDIVNTDGYAGRFNNNDKYTFVINNNTWTNFFVMSLFSVDSGEVLLGDCQLDILSIMYEAGEIDTFYKVFNGDSCIGEIELSIIFYPAGILTVDILEARDLSLKNEDKLIPYCKVIANGIKSDDLFSPFFQTQAIDQGSKGSDPIWNETYKYDIIDHDMMIVEVYHVDKHTEENELIGTGKLKLESTYKTGTTDVWVSLGKEENMWKQNRPHGEVHLKLDFQGPNGVKFPQRHRTAHCYDERYRTNKKDISEFDYEAIQINEVSYNNGEVDETDITERTFSKQEIKSAFKRMDLAQRRSMDKYVIYHLFISAGFIVSRKEVEYLISIYDSNGDGEIAYEEFEKMALDTSASSDYVPPGERCVYPLKQADIQEKPIEPLMYHNGGVADAEKIISYKIWTALMDYIVSNNITYLILKKIIDDEIERMKKDKSDPCNMYLSAYDIKKVLKMKSINGQFRQMLKIYSRLNSYDAPANTVNIKYLLLSIISVMPYTKLDEFNKELEKEVIEECISKKCKLAYPLVKDLFQDTQEIALYLIQCTNLMFNNKKIQNEHVKSIYIQGVEKSKLKFNSELQFEEGAIYYTKLIFPRFAWLTECP